MKTKTTDRLIDALVSAYLLFPLDYKVRIMCAWKDGNYRGRGLSGLEEPLEGLRTTVKGRDFLKNVRGETLASPERTDELAEQIA